MAFIQIYVFPILPLGQPHIYAHMHTEMFSVSGTEEQVRNLPGNPGTTSKVVFFPGGLWS